jgi:hypothetical protein
MEIDTKKFKETMTYAFEKFKTLETEILAYASRPKTQTATTSESDQPTWR